MVTLLSNIKEELLLAVFNYYDSLIPAQTQINDVRTTNVVEKKKRLSLCVKW